MGRANNLLKEARQSACSESEPGRVDHYMEGSKPGQGRRFSVDAARSGARSRIRPAPLRRISYPSEGVPGSHANGRSSIGRRQVQPVFRPAERLAGWSPTLTFPLGRRLDAKAASASTAARLALSRCDRECEVRRLYPPSGADFFKGGSRVRVAALYPCRASKPKSNIPTDSCTSIRHPSEPSSSNR